MLFYSHFLYGETEAQKWSGLPQITQSKWGKLWFTRKSLDPKSQPWTSRLYLLSGYYRRIKRELKGKTGTWELDKRAREDSECSWEIHRNRKEREGKIENTKKRAIKSGSSKSKHRRRRRKGNYQKGDQVGTDQKGHGYSCWENSTGPSRVNKPIPRYTLVQFQTSKHMKLS